MKPFFTIRILVVFLLLLSASLPIVKAGVPACHVLICCRDNNKGMKFLVNGKWLEAHDYKDINQVSDVMQKIKDAGIKIVIIDMTNEVQWTQYWNDYKLMVDNIHQVCAKKNMQFIVFIGAAGGFGMWNEKAARIWKLWAPQNAYRKYGFGDNRPVLIVFQPSDMYWERYNKAPDSEKTYLSKFHLGTTQVNDAILPGKSDGWGYRNYSQSVDGRVRFACPNGGVGPDTWHRIDNDEWKNRIEWAKQADHYSVYGSYDDVCDGIHWGIADTKETDVIRNKYPNNDSSFYYSTLKEILTGKK